MVGVATAGVLRCGVVDTLIVCPFCGNQAHRVDYGFFTKPPGRECEFAELLRCPVCKKIFAPLTGLAVSSTIGTVNPTQ